MVWNLFLFKGDFSVGNSQKSQGTKSGLSHLGNLIFCKNLCTRHGYEQMCCCFGAANHQLPIAVALWIIQIVSAEECLSLKQNLMQIHCSTCSVILDAMATQYTRSLNGIYCPHWLVKWSHHCSLMHIPVRCPWLPGYISVVQTILIILTMAGLFPDRPCYNSVLLTVVIMLCIRSQEHICFLTGSFMPFYQQLPISTMPYSPGNTILISVFMSS